MAAWDGTDMAESQRTQPGLRGTESPQLVSWRRMRRPLFRFALYGTDLLAPAIVYSAAYNLRYGAVPYAPPLEEVMGRPATQFALLVVTVVHFFLLGKAGLYRLHRPWLPLDIVMRIAFVCVVSTLVLSVVDRGEGGAAESRILFVFFWLLLVMYMFAAKLGARIVVLLMLCFGIGVKKVVLVGRTQTAHQLLRTFQQHPQLGYRVIGLTYRGAESSPFEDVRTVRSQSGSAQQVLRGLLVLRPDLVIIADSARKNDEMLELIATCTAYRIEVRLVPEFSEVYSSNLLLDRIGATTMVHLRMLGIPLVSAMSKRAIDLAIALVMLPVLGLVMLFLSPRARRLGVPLLVKTQMVGLGGRSFDLYEFHAELTVRDRPPAWTYSPRVLNVLRGNMSVVGPRAGDPERAAHYNSWEKRMLAVRPGLLGFSAINAGRGRDALAGQMDWDVGYLDQQSMAYDLNHMFMSGLQLLFGRSADSRE